MDETKATLKHETKTDRRFMTMALTWLQRFPQQFDFRRRIHRAWKALNRAFGRVSAGRFRGLFLSWISSVDAMQNCKGSLSRDKFLF
jgi:hypothetical protein